MLATNSIAADKPQNGIQGLKHWRYDLVAGLQVALVSLPLSLGIAIASGAPPVTGLISAIIAGLVLPLLGGSYVTISGPAAGLAPALLAGMLLLGGGDLTAGYPLLLVAIFLTGAVQIVLSLAKAGEFSRILPSAVVEGMLAAIGVIIIIKQIPLLAGDLAAPAKTVLAAAASVPDSLMRLDPAALAVGLVSLALIFILKRSHNRWLTLVPAPITVALAGIALGYLLQLDPKHLIRLPENILEEGFTLPHFSAVWENQSLWLSVLVVVITLTLIDGIESLASIAAIDKIDPFQRRSNPNRTLLAMGVANVCSSVAGGLTIIPGGIKSRANVDAGGRTLWANAYNALFLILLIWLGKDLINRLPLATLAAILIYVGWRLCEPRVFRKTVLIGREQLLLFLITLVSILLTDLLTGIIIGVLSKIALVLYLLTPSFRQVLTSQRAPARIPQALWEGFSALFKSPVIRVVKQDNPGAHYKVYLGSLFCFNLLRLERKLRVLPQDAGVTLVFAESARMIDHTSMEFLLHFKEECLHRGRHCDLAGLDNFYPFSNHSLAARLHDPKLTKEKARLSARAQHMARVARDYGLSFSPSIEVALNEHNFLYLSRGSNKEQSNIMSGDYHGWALRLFDYSYTVPPYYFAEDRHTMLILERPPQESGVPDFILEPEHYLDKYRSERTDINFTQYPLFSRHYFLHGHDEAAIRAFFSAELIRFFDEHPRFYVEARGRHILAFRSDQELEDPARLQPLFEFADMLRKAARGAG